MKHPHLLDNYHSLIGEWFSECPSLKATQVYQRLQARGVKVSYPTVTVETLSFRKKREPIYHPLEFLAGEEAQVDWFFLNLPPLGKLCGFAMILSYSRYLFAHLFNRSSFEFFIEGHLKAFESFGGLPQTLVYDNLSSVVLKRQPLQYNPRFLEFAHHYRFDEDKKVASHPRCFGWNQKMINPLHRSFAKISSEAKRERIFCVIKNMDPVAEMFLNGNQEVGEDPYQTAHQIFTLLPRVSRTMIISAIRECLQKKTPRMKTLFLAHPIATR